MQIVRDGRFTYTVASLIRTDNLQRLADLVDEQDRVVLDAGASSGLFSRFVKQRVIQAPGLLPSEANPILVPVIRSNLAPFDNWTVVTKALSDSEGVVPFYRNHDVPQTSALDRVSAESFGRWPAEEMSVGSTTVDALVEQLALDRIDVLKMDIQGAESRAIAGAADALSRVRKLLIEVSFLDGSPELVLARLQQEFGDPTVVQLVSGGADLLYARS